MLIQASTQLELPLPEQLQETVCKWSSQSVRERCGNSLFLRPGHHTSLKKNFLARTRCSNKRNNYDIEVSGCGNPQCKIYYIIPVHLWHLVCACLLFFCCFFGFAFIYYLLLFLFFWSLSAWPRYCKLWHLGRKICQIAWNLRFVL